MIGLIGVDGHYAGAQFQKHLGFKSGVGADIDWRSLADASATTTGTDPATTASDPSAEPDLGMLISRVYRDLESAVWDILAAQDYTDIGPRHGTVLAHLTPEGVRATELAKASGQHKQIVGTVVDELERAGYVTRQPDPADRRAKLVVPTEKGLAEITTARAAIAAYKERCTSVLGAERFRAFAQALKDLAHQ